MFHRSLSAGLLLTVATALTEGARGHASHLVGCAVLPAPGDTERFVGIPRSSDPPGSLREWTDATGRLYYVESWSIGADKHSWDGSIVARGESPQAYVAQRLRNGKAIVSEGVERVGDSVVTATPEKKSVVRLAADLFLTPGLLTTPARMVLAQCTLARTPHELETSAFGRVRAEEVATTMLRSGTHSQRVRLFLLFTGDGNAVARVWVDDTSRIIAYPGAEGAMDLVRPEWAGARDQLLDAEVRAASPYCHSGPGIGTCEPSTRVCNLPTSTGTTAVAVRSVQISDSGYSIRSDGRGAYSGTTDNVFVPGVGDIAGLILLQTPPADQTARFFTVDLDHPVPGDIGKPLGVIKVDGRFPGRFVRSASAPRNELVAHANTDWDYHQNSLSEVPVGDSITVDQIDLDFYVNGVLHVLQMGILPYGHCKSAGTAIYGDGTTSGTVSHPDPDRWIVVLPAGGIGRLFENRAGDPTAVNRGLYYVSLRLVIQR